MFEMFLINLHDWVVSPYFYAAVMLPLVVSMYCIFKYKQETQGLNFILVAAGFLATTTLTYLTAFWSDEGLHLFPLAGLLAAGVTLWARQGAWLVFPFCFFSLLTVDLTVAFDRPTYPYGIGGAGFGDGLFVMPVFYGLTVLVANKLPERIFKRPAPVQWLLQSK